jgi:hypothetical protein
MVELQQQPSYDAVIPYEVRHDKQLSSTEKIIYAEIRGLMVKEGYCWARNNFFAELFDVSEKTISRTIKKLHNLGYIQVSYTDGDYSKRIIKLPSIKYQNVTKYKEPKPKNTMDKNVPCIGQKCPMPSDKNVPCPPPTHLYRNIMNNKYEVHKGEHALVAYPDLVENCKNENDFVQLKFYESETLEAEKNNEDYQVWGVAYKQVVMFLFGINKFSLTGSHILKLPKQLKFEEFVKVAKFSERKAVSLPNLLESLLNNTKYTKDRISVYAILTNWLNRTK